MGRFSNNLRKRVVNKGEKIGFCVICGTYGPLSRDHVPPKACNNLNDVELKTLLPSKEYSKVGITSQGGTHYKTLCSACNSTRLGKYYDPWLIELSNEITSLVMGARNRKISLPEQIYPFIRPQRIARAVVGHCLAAVAVEETRTGLFSSPIGDSLRNYFLDQTAHLPKKLDIYYWPYPSKRQVIIKGMGKSSMSSKQTIVGHVIKFLPLGFWLVWNKPQGVTINTNKLISDKAMGIDEIQQVKLDLYHIPSLGFPEVPEGHEYVALNDSYTVVGNQKTRI